MGFKLSPFQSVEAVASLRTEALEGGGRVGRRAQTPH